MLLYACPFILHYLAFNDEAHSKSLKSCRSKKSYLENDFRIKEQIDLADTRYRNGKIITEAVFC